MNCAPVLSIMGPLVTMFGVLALCLGILAWIRPGSKIVQILVFECYAPAAEADPLSRFLGFTRERAGPANLWAWRFLGPINGSVFFGVGVLVTVGQIQCGYHLPDIGGLVGPLRFEPWRPSVAVILFTAAIGFWNSYKMGPLWCAVFVLLSAAFGFGATQGGAFHTGIQAQRWFIVTVGIGLLMNALYLLKNRFQNRAAAATSESS